MARYAKDTATKSTRLHQTKLNESVKNNSAVKQKFKVKKFQMTMMTLKEELMVRLNSVKSRQNKIGQMQIQWKDCACKLLRNEKI